MIKIENTLESIASFKAARFVESFAHHRKFFVTSGCRYIVETPPPYILQFILGGSMK